MLKKSLRTFFVLLSFIAVSTLSLASNPLEVKTHTLSNGLTVWLNEDHSQPKIVGAVVVKAGAKDTPNTGIAHYFEHIMFKGTDKIGTINYVAEKVYLDSISVKYDELAVTADIAKRKEIQKEINRLSIEAAKFSIPNEFDRLISKYGGTGLNAGTGFDMTMYYNTFSPQYFAQWCELNSERLISPVFRGFQSELETVYEEKNMYDDALGSTAVEKALERIFKPHPYQFPIIGSTENLKNPRLSDMKDFFEKYYVAGNMGLVLSGDFDAEQILPIIEKTFGRIRPGNVTKSPIPQPSPFKGKETFTAKLPIPIVNINALVWRSVPSNHPDEIPLKIAMNLLSNSNKTGLLDKLSNDGKLMQAMGLNLGMNDAGILALVAIPNIPFQSNNAAQKHVLNALDQLKTGVFSEEQLNSLKMEAKRNYLRELEKIDNRVNKMLSLFAESSSWEDYLDEINRIDALQKEDVVAVVNKYFTSDYLDLRKKTGKYPKEKMEKPGFAPIQPQNKDKQSDYALELEKMTSPETSPRFLDFEKDVAYRTLDNKGLVHFYHTPNPMNDVFSLDINYNIGKLEMKEAEVVAVYLEYLGTDSLTVDQFNEKLQQLGSTISFTSSHDNFSVRVSGFDENFDKTIALVGDFLKNVKPDKSKLKKITSAYNISEKAIRSSSDELATAALEKVKYGNKSIYINKLSLSDIKALTAEELLNSFRKILSTECEIHYCGTLDEKSTSSLLKAHLEMDKVVNKTSNPVFREGITYAEPQVFFYNDPKAAQSIIYGYVNGPKTANVRENNTVELFNSYFGGSMNSLMFQEIREFRSMAYRASSWVNLPPANMTSRAIPFNMMLSTQADKTIEAVQTLDSIYRFMPLEEKRLETAKQDIVNYAYNNYPDFRNKSPRIANGKTNGYSVDPNKLKVENTSPMMLEDLGKLYKESFEKAPVVYVVIGNQKKIDMAALEKFGKITVLKQKDILK